MRSSQRNRIGRSRRTWRRRIKHGWNLWSRAIRAPAREFTVRLNELLKRISRTLRNYGLTADNSCQMPMPVCRLSTANPADADKSRSRSGLGLDAGMFADWSRTWTARGHGQTAVVGADWIRAWTDHDCGHCVDATRTEPQLLRGHYRTMRGCCPNVVRQRRGYCAEIAPDISPDAACLVSRYLWTLCGRSPDIRRTLCGHYATCRLIFDKGMGFKKNDCGWPVRQPLHNAVSEYALKWRR